jgi:hypothetical protein
MRHSTQYAIVYKGSVDLTMTFATRVDVDAYVRTAVAHGHDAADYGVAHRAVTYGDWALTTPTRDWRPTPVGTTPDTHALLTGDRDVVDVELPELTDGGTR